MPGDQTFEQKLRSHVGGLIRVCYDGWTDHTRLNGKIGLLMSVICARRGVLGDAQIKLLIDGSVKILVVYPGQIELLGADDA